jgi:hypothetical protein
VKADLLAVLNDSRVKGKTRDLVQSALAAPRLGRNLRDLIDIVTTVGERQVGVTSLTSGIVDTSTARGKPADGPEKSAHPASLHPPVCTEGMSSRCRNGFPSLWTTGSTRPTG